MEQFGLLILAGGAWGVYCGVTSIRPLATIVEIVKDPSSASAIVTGAVAAAKSSGAAQGTIVSTGGDFGGTPTAASVGNLSDLQTYAESLFGQYGWSSSEIGPLVSLWTRESGWNYKATNPTSGAYGIPQALPGSKMATAGLDWKTNPQTQIKWGLGYIKGRYGTPTAAWAHEESAGWY